MDILGWVGTDNTEVLDFLADIDAWALPLDDDVAWCGNLGLDLSSSVEDDTSLALGVWQPTFDDHVLWLGWKWSQSFNDDLSWWWWETFA